MMATQLKLYEIIGELQSIEEALIDADGELTPELEAQLNAVEGDFHEKAENIAKFITVLMRRADMVEAEMMRLSALKQSRRNAAAGLKVYLLKWMQAISRPTIETPLFKIWIQKNSRPSIKYDGDVHALPIKLQKVTTTFDSQAAYEMWKAEEVLPAEIQVDRGHHLRIR